VTCSAAEFHFAVLRSHITANNPIRVTPETARLTIINLHPRSAVNRCANSGIVMLVVNCSIEIPNKRESIANTAKPLMSEKEATMATKVEQITILRIGLNLFINIEEAAERWSSAAPNCAD